MSAIVLQDRWVPDPLMSDAEFIHQKEQERDRLDRGKGRGNPHIGMVQVSVNMQGLLGGFCRFRGNQSQIKAIAHFKNLYEQSQIGGGRACDPSVEPVDGGGINPEAMFERGVDARRAYSAATVMLGRTDTQKLLFVVIRERGPTPFAAHFGPSRKPNAKQISAGMVEIRRIADRLAVHFKMMGRE